MNTQRIVMATLIVAAIIMGTSGKNMTTAQQNPIAARLTQNPVSAPDRQFAIKAAQDNIAEIELGQLASQRALNSEVKQFGQRMVRDHTQASAELKELATQKGITLPQDIGEENRKMKANLSKLSGVAFDEAYINHMVAEHNQDVSLFGRQSRQGNDPDLKAWAAKTLPILQEHLQLARSLSQKLPMHSRL